MKKRTSIILQAALWCAVVTGAAAAPRLLDGALAEDNPLQKAKQLVYSQEWGRAQEELRLLIAANPAADVAVEALYWRGYCLNQLAVKNAAAASAATAVDNWKRAFAEIEALRRHYPASKWKEPAEMLRIEIAQHLVAAGQKEFAAHISRAAEQTPDNDLKLVAVDALLQMDSGKALPILERLIHQKGDPRLQEKALFVVSQFDDPRVITLLEEVARRGDSLKLREQAIYWIGQSSGHLPLLRRLYAELGEPQLKKKAIFAISQQGDDEAAEALLAIAKSGGEPLPFREQAIFWLGQQAVKGNIARLAGLYSNLAEKELRKKVIFSLSQVGNAEAIARLEAIFRLESDPELKKQVIFWMGQIDHPAARKFIEQILGGK